MGKTGFDIDIYQNKFHDIDTLMILIISSQTSSSRGEYLLYNNNTPKSELTDTRSDALAA